jgi:diacylglycerol O-acyltransferase
MHVGGLLLFQPPPDAGRDFIRDVYDAMLQSTDVQPTFCKHPAFFGGITNLAWSYDDDVELDYHVRLSALPQPGRVRDLLELTSHLHASLLDRHRPLWETHLVEGLYDGRFAVYTKFHHALFDGVSAMKLLQRALSTDPHDDTVRVPWALPPPRRDRTQPARSPIRALTGAIGSVAGLGPSTVSLERSALIQQRLTFPFRAPPTMFNVAIGGARRVAAQSWPLQRIQPVRAAADATVNDVVLAMCAGALREYLLDHDALPDRPLIALVPVSLRSDDDDSGGNNVGAVLCNFNTHLEDPAERLAGISASMRDNKAVFGALPRLQQAALSSVTTGGPAAALGPGILGVAPPPFNLVISNVPGPREPLYWRGAQMAGSYPLSVPFDGFALNITVTGGSVTTRGEQISPLHRIV